MAAGRSMVITAHLRHGVQTHSVHGLWGKIILHYLVPIVWKERRGWVEGIYCSKIGTMTFKELFSQFSFAEIRPAFLNLWQTNEPKLVEHLDLDKWERIYQNVQALEAKSSQYYIRLGYRWETCSPMIDMNCSVYDKVDNHLDCPMACYPLWSEIAGMEVVVEKDIVITPQELVAGLLWEITYFGGTEEIARKSMERTFHGGTK
ncbi:DUF6557 family protein [Bacteroides finegoldii]|nr:DUF6557 family protein [Bacteroides finegoldii]